MATLALRWRDGREETVAVRAAGDRGDEAGDPDGASGETVLEAAERAGLSLPFGCRTGVCSTCTGRLLAGELDHERPPRALKRRHLDDGYVLPCIAVPAGDCTVEVGTAVHRDLLVNPLR